MKSSKSPTGDLSDIYKRKPSVDYTNKVIIINLKCLLFCLGMPGLFGRNFLIYASSLKDNSDKTIFCVTTNPVLVLLNTVFVLLKLVFILPAQWLCAFCRFYTRKHESPKEIIKRLSANNIR